MVYGYARVSTEDQNLDRQLIQLRQQGIEDRNILCDKASGKNFERRAWASLVGSSLNAPLLRQGDLLVITSLDRMGRNYSEIRDQWQMITKDIKADIRVLDMPLLDTSSQQESLDRRFIADLVLQILSYTEEKERTAIKKRQAEGIAAARSEGKALGRPCIRYPAGWEAVYPRWTRGEMTAVQAMRELNLKRTSFYKLANSCRADAASADK